MSMKWSVRALLRNKRKGALATLFYGRKGSGIWVGGLDLMG